MDKTVHAVDLNAKSQTTPINIPDCYTKIAELAYYKAEIRSFNSGYELDDWLEAEREFIEKYIPKQ